ncbi:MAG: DUF805 domain-containing protein [Salaquimonas sp.]|jgi:uncharacterized membrane protein YhaH (DUF805 family)|nr:DUF805 domain-containing protein [Salaquimonas sp.]
MSFFRAIFSAIRNYFNISGRSNRREFWYWLGFVVLAYLLLRYFEVNYLAIWAGYLPYEEPDQFPAWLIGMYPALSDEVPWMPDFLSWISSAWLVFCIIPTLTLIVRRVHDHDRPGWMALTIVPLVWWLVAKGTKGPNRYG